MGKIVEKKKKKKGRPSLLDLQKRNLREQQLQQQQQQQIQQNSKRSVSAPQVTHNYDYATTTPVRRSTRRNPNLSPEDNDEEKDEDEEDEKDEELARKKRREKKLKLVLKLPSSEQKSPANSESRGSDTNPEERSAGPSHKKRKINSIGDGSGIAYSKKGDKSVSGANPTSNSQGEQLDSGPSTALPDKKLLLFILDRLQKKDTYGVFSEPVDPEELPDYHEVIEHPMDFGTIRKKLDIGAYANLEQFEKDVFLVCSNAMQYNAPDTIYFRQARSIQELAKKNFENLRQDSDDDEAEPKVIRRGRPPTKNLKKPLGRPALERAASEFSSDATLATGAEKISNHDMRKGPLPSDKSTVADSAGKFYGSRNDVYTGLFTDRSDEGSNLKGYNMKNGKRHFVPDDNRRNTYKLYHPSAAMHEGSVLTTFDGERKQLLAVGVYLDLGYTRSLARFAANLDPVAWKIASKRIERCLPGGVNFGPGWVGENDIPPQRPLSLPALSLPPAQPTSSQPCTVRQNPSAPTRETIENEMTNSSAGAGSVMPPFQFRQNSAIHPGMNGYNGGYGFNLTAQMAKNIGVARPSGLNLQSSQMLDSVCRSATTFAHSATANSNSDDPKSSENSCTKNPDRPLPNSVGEAKADPRSGLQPQPSWQGLPRRQKSDSRLSTQPKPDSRLLPQQKPDPVPPDLNIRFQSPSSPSSGRVDSAQPDLALQL